MQKDRGPGENSGKGGKSPSKSNNFWDESALDLPAMSMSKRYWLHDGPSVGEGVYPACMVHQEKT